VVKSKLLSSVTGVAALLVTGLLAAVPAQADTFNLTSCHISTGCPAAGTVFGTVAVTQSGTSVDFLVVLNNGSRFVETGAGANQLFLFNSSSPAFAFMNELTGMPANAVPGGLSGMTASPPVMADGTGLWNAGIECTIASNCNGGSTPTFQEITFTVTNTTLAQVEAANAAGNIFVADILCGATVTGCAGNTGPVDATPTAVPDGGMTLMLLGGALVGFESLRRRLRV
jgi:hypothetical protein